MGGRVRNLVVLFVAAAAWGAASCGGDVPSGTPYYYHVLAEYDTGSGAGVLDFETALNCDKWSGASCVTVFPSGAVEAVDPALAGQILPDGCDCTGFLSLDFSNAGIRGAPDRFELAANAAAAGRVAGTESGLLWVTSGGSACAGRVRVTKAGRLPSDTPGFSYLDIGGVFDVSCPGFEVENGMFHINPREIELGLDR